MNIYIYDIEVFSDDWIVVFRNPEAEDNHVVIHNDNYHLRAFLDQPDIVIGGFNNKHYDDYVLMTMLNGGDNLEVKKCNDWIIGGNEPWTFPFLQFQKKPFNSFDLRDDIADPGISLKAIEGNLKLPIVESSVPFDIDRKLTPKELEEVIRYCKYDVDSTVRLYHERKEDYLDAKVLVGEMYDVPPEEALGLTNAKLSAKVLGAKAVKRTDERDYVIPDNIDTDLIPKIILDFFLQIRDKSISDAKLFGAGKGSKGMTLDIMLKTSYGSCPVTYAWGGVHGAKPCVTVEETKDRVIVNQDVGSLYPNSMINFGYCSRSMADPDAYVKLVRKRLGYKKAGDKKRANALKLVVNTVYGAMLNLYNDLADRWAGRSVCISNQLAMTVLIVQLAKQCKTIDFVNINTDGIMFTIDRNEVELSEAIIATWCEITKFEMERDDFVKVIQKDVNNYIGIKADGEIKSKGGYVSLYKGGNFKTNSLQIIHKAIVEYLVNGVPAEKTINECTDIFAFQQIVKTGGTYEGAYHYINDYSKENEKIYSNHDVGYHTVEKYKGEKVPIQKVNRIYAVKDSKYGAVVKGKWITEKRKKDKATGKMISEPVDPPQWSETVISECPEHTFIDNENVLTVDDLDKGYYIDMAKKRIDKYINIDPTVKRKIEKISKEVVIMATEKTVTTKAVDMNVYQKLAEARARFLATPVKKSGVNRFAEYKYFELEDIVPVATKIFNDLGLLFVITFTSTDATGILFDTDNPEKTIVFNSPMVPLTVTKTDKDGNILGDFSPAGMNSVQALGGSETYQRRYLYMACLDIVEADAFDGTNGKPTQESGKTEAPVTKKATTRPATTEEREETKKELINEGGTATDTQVKAIKNGLKKLRSKENSDYESYVGECVKKLKAGITKTEAEDMLIEIGEKIEE